MPTVGSSMKNLSSMTYVRLSIPPLMIFLLLLAVYLWSMPKTVVLEDDGYFILAAYFGGYAHPPGYPLYSLLGHFATMVPIGSVASRVHGLSAVIGAVTCVCLWFFVRQLFGFIYSKQAASTYFQFSVESLGLLVALCFGFSEVFWSQAIIAEVYSLSVLLFLILCCLVLELKKTGQNNYLLGLCGFIVGLSLSNHWPLFVLSSPLLFAFLWPDRKRFFRYFIIALPFTGLGLLPYAWMIYRSFVIPELNFGGPFSSLAEFWRFVSREDFANVDTSPSADWHDKLGFLLFVFKETARQFSLPLAALVAIGFIQQWRRLPLNISIGLLLGFLGNTLFLILLLDFDYDLFHQNTFRVYPVIAYAICAIWLGLGVNVLVEKICRSSGKYNQKWHFVSVIILLTGTVFATNVPKNYRADDTWAEDYAKAMLIGLDKNAVLFANADTVNGPVGYLNLVEGFREDVTLQSGFSINISDKLVRLYRYKGEVLHGLVNTFVDEQQRPIFYTNDFPHDCGIASYGLFFEVNKNNCDHSNDQPLDDLFQVKIAPRAIKYFTKIASSPQPSDPWEIMHYRLLRKDFCQLLINSTDMGDLLAELENNYEDVTYHALFEVPYYTIACDHYLGITTLIDALLRQTSPAWELVNSFISIAKIRRDNEALSKSDMARLDYLEAEMWLFRNDHDKALQAYQRSLSIWPHPDNPANKGILTMQDNKRR